MAYNSRYSALRAPLYFFLFVITVILLGLTGYRIHHTISVASFHDPIVAELLSASVITLVWIPAALFFLSRSASASNDIATDGLAGLVPEFAGWAALWILWLVGAAIATSKWPTKSSCGPGKQCSLLLTIVAFAWIGFSILTFIAIVGLMQYASLSGPAAATTPYTTGSGPVYSAGATAQPTPAPVTNPNMTSSGGLGVMV